MDRLSSAPQNLEGFQSRASSILSNEAGQSVESMSSSPRQTTNPSTFFRVHTPTGSASSSNAVLMEYVTAPPTPNAPLRVKSSAPSSGSLHSDEESTTIAFAAPTRNEASSFPNPMWSSLRSQDPRVIFDHGASPIVNTIRHWRDLGISDNQFYRNIETEMRLICSFRAPNNIHYRDEMLMMKMATQLWSLGPDAGPPEWDRIIQEWFRYYCMIYSDEWAIHPTFKPPKLPSTAGLSEGGNYQQN